MQSPDPLIPQDVWDATVAEVDSYVADWEDQLRQHLNDVGPKTVEQKLYAEDQPRDEHGRFAGVGGSVEIGSKATRADFAAGKVPNISLGDNTKVGPGVAAQYQGDGKVHVFDPFFAADMRPEVKFSLLWHEFGHEVSTRANADSNEKMVEALRPFRIKPDNPWDYDNFSGMSQRPEEMIADIYSDLMVSKKQPWEEEGNKYSAAYRYVLDVAEKSGLPLPKWYQKPQRQKLEANPAPEEDRFETDHEEAKRVTELLAILFAQAAMNEPIDREKLGLTEEDIAAIAERIGRDRAAEIMGLKWDGENLVPDPEADKAITNTTEKQVNEAVDEVVANVTAEKPPLEPGDTWAPGQGPDDVPEEGMTPDEEMALAIAGLFAFDAVTRPEMVADMETGMMQNQLALEAYEAAGVTQVLVSDGDFYDAECAQADGEVWSIEYAKTRLKEHPNCVRAFSPIGLGLAALRAKRQRLYAEDQERDDHGRFADEGKGGASSEAWREPRPGGYSAPEIAKREAWEQSMLGAVSRGEVSPKDAENRDLRGVRAEDWKPLPQNLYHVTTAADAVEAGGLKSRYELSQGSGHGLGGGDDKSISFTEDPKVAEGIMDAFREAHDVADGSKSTQQMIDEAKDGGFLPDLMRLHGVPDWKSGDPLPLGVLAELRGVSIRSGNAGDPPRSYYGPRGEEIKTDPSVWTPVPEGGSWKGRGDVTYYHDFSRPMTEDEARESRFDFYKGFAVIRESKTGRLDPLFFTSDVKALAKMDPIRDVAVMHYKPEPGAMGTQMSALGEWRAYSGKAVKLVSRRHAGGYKP